MHDAVLRVHEVGCEAAHRGGDAPRDRHGVPIADPAGQPPHRRVGAEPGAHLVAHRLVVAAELLGVVARDERDVRAVGAQALPDRRGVAEEVVADEQHARRAWKRGSFMA